MGWIESRKSSTKAVMGQVDHFFRVRKAISLPVLNVMIEGEPQTLHLPIYFLIRVLISHLSVTSQRQKIRGNYWQVITERGGKLLPAAECTN